VWWTLAFIAKLIGRRHDDGSWGQEGAENPAGNPGETGGIRFRLHQDDNGNTPGNYSQSMMSDKLIISRRHKCEQLAIRAL